MKKYTLPFVLAVAGLVFPALEAEAQLDRAKVTPAEVPPASFSGKQYVDSRGCVYIRAGVDGATRWVPRVARNRQVVCGFPPSQTSAATRTASAPAAAAPRASVEQIQPKPSAAAATAAAAVASAPQAAAASSAPRTTFRKPTRTVASKPAVRRVAKSQPRPQQQPVRRVVVQRAPVDNFGRQGRIIEPVVSKNPTCQGASAVSQRYMSGSRDARCGPQAQTPFTFKDAPQRYVNAKGKIRRVPARTVHVYPGTSGATQVTGSTVIAPRTSYLERRPGAAMVPQGYKPAWDDGRLNPQRAHQTLDGRRRMLLTWTNTLPRQLVDKYTGENVTRFFPNLRYPYTSPRQQAAALGTTVAPQGYRAITRTNSTPRGEVTMIQPRAVSTKSAPQKAKVKVAAPTVRKAQPASHRFVQAGPFHADKAHIVVKKFRSAGLPVKVSEFTRQGKTYRYVLAGPYADQSHLSAGMKAVQRMGYSGAKLRK